MFDDAATPTPNAINDSSSDDIMKESQKSTHTKTKKSFSKSRRSEKKSKKSQVEEEETPVP